MLKFERIYQNRIAKNEISILALKIRNYIKEEPQKGEKGFIRNSTPAMPFTPARLPFFRKKKVPWVKKSILVNKTSGVQT